MNRILRSGYLAVAFLIVFALVIPSSAATISFSSDLVNESNNQTGTNVSIVPHDVWASGGGWVSFANTGKGGFFPPNTTITGTPTAVFWESVFLPNTNNAGWIEVWADDTASVIVTNSLHPAGLLLHSANNVWAPNCTAQPIGCVNGMSWIGALDNTILAQGLNTFTMPTFQLWGDVSGLKYRGEINSTNAVPEPSTFALMGFGLIIIGYFARRKRVQ